MIWLSAAVAAPLGAYESHAVDGDTLVVMSATGHELRVTGVVTERAAYQSSTSNVRSP